MSRKLKDVSKIINVLVDGKRCRCVSEIIWDFDKLYKGIGGHGKVKCLMDNERWEYVEGVITIACDLNPYTYDDITAPPGTNDPENLKDSIIKMHEADTSVEIDEPAEYVRESNVK